MVTLTRAAYYRGERSRHRESHLKAVAESLVSATPILHKFGFDSPMVMRSFRNGVFVHIALLAFTI
jgi:hypothetical protein